MPFLPKLRRLVRLHIRRSSSRFTSRPHMQYIYHNREHLARLRALESDEEPAREPRSILRLSETSVISEGLLIATCALKRIGAKIWPVHIYYMREVNDIYGASHREQVGHVARSLDVRGNEFAGAKYQGVAEEVHLLSLSLEIVWSLEWFLALKESLW